MTPAQEQSLLKHLAEHVMGWQEYGPDGNLYTKIHTGGWNPLKNAKDALEVFARFPGRTEYRFRVEDDDGQWLVEKWLPIGLTYNPGRWEFFYRTKKLAKALCLACADATGWEG